MPNWCTNHLWVHGPDDELDAFTQAIANDDDTISILANIVPMPAVLDGTRSPAPGGAEPLESWQRMLDDGTIDTDAYERMCADQRDAYGRSQRALAETGYSDWHSWQMANWGIKWGDSGAKFLTDPSDETVDTLHLFFETPWAPPAEGLHAVSEKFPALTFTLGASESGMAFMVAYRWQAGELIAETETAYPDCRIVMDDDPDDWDWDGELEYETLYTLVRTVDAMVKP
jgi:hypothetical protein